MEFTGVGITIFGHCYKINDVEKIKIETLLSENDIIKKMLNRVISSHFTIELLNNQKSKLSRLIIRILVIDR